ncbi:NAD-dependent epimerase/dehydratase family protein, partial [Candidatus Bathyarchaeota archaeon]|nr:NAD-dependent epimerase/dehydratase family protein [Candidatus Bathyarchaeota archaeon]
MHFKPSKILITGGAGFIGSHLVDRLMMGGQNVTVFDNLSNGSLKNLESWLENEHFRFIKGDLKKLGDVGEAVKGIELVFHLAANPEVRVGETDPYIHFQENLMATFNLLEAVRKSASAKTFVFFSTSTVYGEAAILPTPENYGPSIPISTYGASKLGCEALVSSYAHTFGLRALILRVANVVGSRANHGVIIDFINKLETDPRRLEILGDGTQKKSYLHIEDFIDATLRLTSRFLDDEKKVDIYNVGSVDQIEVKKIAEVVAEEIGFRDVAFVFTGGVDGGRGWLGDVKIMLLSIDKLMKT